MQFSQPTNFEAKMSIPEYFAGKTIMITGATGFMGKALVEKILRSCPEVSTIYVIIRTKKGTDPQQRWSEITKLALFDVLKVEQPDALDKVVAIPGDSTLDHFGISDEHRKILIENVNIIYHVAASVNFTEELISALKLNVKSTNSILELAKKMPKLECFVYASTAYSNIEKTDFVEERVYESPLNWRTIMKLCEDEKYVNCLPFIQPRIMSGHQTTYTLTKRVAESMVEEYSQYFPVVIMRPSLVLASLEDPFPGWIDSHNALTLLCDAVRVGVVRIINCDRNRSLQFVSLDLSIKAFLIATWKAHEKGMKNGIDVYCTSMGNEKTGGISMTWTTIVQTGLDLCEYFPSERQMWHPSCMLVRNTFLMTLIFFCVQILPATFGDLYSIATGAQPQFLKLTARYYRALTGPLKGFSGRDYDFAIDNFLSLDTILLPQDKKGFGLKLKTDSVGMYRVNATGMAKYLMKEDFSPEAYEKRKNRFKIFRLIHRVLTVALVASALYVFFKKTSFL